MMSARLTMECEILQRTLARSRRAFLWRSEPTGRAHLVIFDVRTLVRDDAGLVREDARSVPVLYELAPDHPATPPIVVAGQPDLFNTHIHDPRDGCDLPPVPFVCLGQFLPGMRLADWVVATFYVLAWDRIAADHPLNAEAAAWARLEMGRGRFPIDRRGFFETETGKAQSEPASGVPARGLRLRQGGAAS